jgi:transcription-repair coupling factor (superfamily II helicase)
MHDSPLGIPPSVPPRHNGETEHATKDIFMKRTPLMIAILSAAAFVVGCNKEETATQQLDNVQAKTAEAAQGMKDYTYAQKTEFTETMQANLAEINKDMDQLAAKIEKSSDAVKAEAKPKLQALREQADKLNKQLDVAKSATESTWDDVKAGTRKAYESLKESFQQSRQWVSEKIAP